eukprot:TRINITY_DN100434_c0_g1_i1.p1 TRINITY_DN100434_c0_g1~~TRINITY_DN100434_c0_g1_i1.p1  ORF type:complete len:422 (-),score=95.21 TRINITY_DN100434_c0_g1_i1:61-1326(-)
MGSDSRYLVEVGLQHSTAEALSLVWSGCEEEHEGQSLQEERLELRPDGSFDHRISHQLGGSHSSSSCTGTWKLFHVKHFGADADALGDRELHFESTAGKLLLSKLVVCGANPQVNGFIGHTCRLYPETSPNQRPRPRLSSHPSEDDKEEEWEELGQEHETPDEETVKLVAEAAGCSLDQAMAALMEQSGSAEQAITWLVEHCTGSPDTTGKGKDLSVENLPEISSGDSCEREDSKARQLHEATGRPLAQCRSALSAHGGHVDDAALYLFTLPPQEGVASNNESAPLAADQARFGSGLPGEAVQAARLAELTGKPHKACLEMLRAHGGQPDAAAAALLGPAASDISVSSVAARAPLQEVTARELLVSEDEQGADANGKGPAQDAPETHQTGADHCKQVDPGVISGTEPNDEPQAKRTRTEPS